MGVVIGLICWRIGKTLDFARDTPDEYLGRVHKNGRMYRHDPLSPDDHIGHLAPPVSPYHAGAAFLLLVVPSLEEEE